MEIKVENLHKSFDDNFVLRGIDLTIVEGSVTAIIGGSGTGKTVLLKHLMGLLKPDKGSIFIDGQDIVPFSEARLAPIRRKFGMVFQTGGLLSSLTVGGTSDWVCANTDFIPKRRFAILSRKNSLLSVWKEREI